MERNYSKITPEIQALAEICRNENIIDKSLYEKYKVNRGLRDLNGNGVLTGLTEISDVISKKPGPDGTPVPCEGSLYYRGYNVKELTAGFIRDGRMGFEEVTYLLLMGSLPTEQQLRDFNGVLGTYRSLPTSFVRDIIMKAPSDNVMNSLARSVLTLYAYDNNADDTSIPNVLRQCIQLIALFPQLAAYAYQISHYYHGEGRSLILHDPEPTLSTSENILHMLRSDSKYTALEASILDLCLILHAEHGGGNNSSFTTHVVTSSGTDTYSAIASALGSLKGPKHGGANIKVCEMFADIREHVRDWNDNDEIEAYLARLLSKDAFDRSGLIYGIGHAIYSVSDPRAEILKGFVKQLSAAKGREDEFKLYSAVEELAPKVIVGNKKMYKGVSANVDFYSGFVYDMLGIPMELYTPLFAIARITGWSAHRLEELINAGKIIRPAYKAVGAHREYIAMSDR